MKRALILIKPDAIERGIENKLISQILSFANLVHIADVVMTEKLCDKHYVDHLSKPFYPGLKTAMVGKKLIAIEVSSPLGVERIREFCEGIRKEYVDSVYIGPRNVVHCSDSDAAADRECELWFGLAKDKIIKDKPKKDKNVRKASKITDVDAFIAQVIQNIPCYNVDNHLARDLNKVAFDWENYGYEKDDYPMYGDLIGYNEIEGIPFFGVVAGGDWQYPVFIAFYLDQDGKSIRAFIPKDGNCWNYKTNEAFGNNGKEDADFLNNYFNLIADDRYEFVDDDEGERLIDIEKIKAEIVKRFIVV